MQRTRKTAPAADTTFSTMQRVRPQLSALTSLRFFAALAVVLYHYGGGYRGQDIVPLLSYPPLIRELTRVGYSGVSFFFVLSGFIIAYNYGDLHSWGFRAALRFWRARFARLYPLYLLVHTAAILLLFALLGGPSPATLSHLELQWVVGLLSPQASPDVPAWSIAVEMAFYLAFPLVANSVLRLCTSQQRTLGLIMISFAGETAAFAWTITAFGHGDWGTISREALIDGPLMLATYFNWYLRFWEFLFGCALAVLVFRHGFALHSQRARLSSVLVGTGGVVGIALGSQDLLPGDPLVQLASWYVAFTPFFGLIIIGVAAGPVPLGDLLLHPRLVELGDASYALYLLHWVPIMVFRHAAPYVPPLAAPVGVLVTVVCSLASYHWIETPARRWIRGKTSGKSPLQLMAPDSLEIVPVWR